MKTIATLGLLDLLASLMLLASCSTGLDRLVSLDAQPTMSQQEHEQEQRIKAWKAVQKRRKEQKEREAGQKRMDSWRDAQRKMERDKIEAKRLADIAALDSTDKIKALLVANTISIGMTEKEFTLSNLNWKLSSETLMRGSVFRHWEEGRRYNGGRSVMTHNYRVANITR